MRLGLELGTQKPSRAFLIAALYGATERLSNDIDQFSCQRLQRLATLNLCDSTSCFVRHFALQNRAADLVICWANCLKTLQDNVAPSCANLSQGCSKKHMADSFVRKLKGAVKPCLNQGKRQEELC